MGMSKTKALNRIIHVSTDHVHAETLDFRNEFIFWFVNKGITLKKKDPVIFGDFTVFWTFYAMYAAFTLKLCSWLSIFDLQIKLKYGCYRPFLEELYPLNLAI
jgi:hypothetical protein